MSIKFILLKGASQDERKSLYETLVKTLTITHIPFIEVSSILIILPQTITKSHTDELFSKYKQLEIENIFLVIDLSILISKL